ncbi:4'-phosphopantetheinyl transferase superfamily protein [Mycoavidus sp. B2-EB]|uniref:4'-phosphopantetheinyl transferase family protein n=1 Tax=Mycoavidus sp. B2-EB TaxID=2651972 RepID=UPI0016274E68|nr:4'-phosphopantetheinyl transferase superfamily protein [Mycoavidus sp. B2-EB]BBO59623.1 4'-phosphopantetheinyl transferase [Mycoavidus sp. B2-EB]
MLELSPERIDLWLVFFDAIQDEALLNQYRGLLTEEERYQEKRFYFVKDQRRYLVTRALVRTVLSRYARIAPEQWLFAANAYGCPEIANSGLAQKISFNLSHTQSLIVLGVTTGNALGVDTENIRVRRAPVEVAHQHFAPDEVRALRELSLEAQHQVFFQYWTLKESYIKARGMGLSIPLDQFSFHFMQDHEIEISIHPVLKDHPSRWHFWQFQPTMDYLVAVCAERFGSARQTLTMKNCIPLIKEEPLDQMLCQIPEKEASN